MTKQIFFGVGLLVVAIFASSIQAQEPGSIAGNVTLQSSREGIPEVEVTLCSDTGRQVVSITEGVGQLPPRDQLQTIRITALPGEPGQVSVTSVSDACPDVRRTTTDNAGHFAFSGVVPGPYKVHVQRNGYIGETLRGSPGSPPTTVTRSVTVISRQAVPDISFSLIKGAAIAGTVYDSNGKPLVAANVQALSAKGGPGLVARQTDDRGQYRLFGLPPGEFIVAVRAGTLVTIDSLVDSRTYMLITRQPDNTRSAPTYHPSGLSPADAKTIVLREGEEVAGVDVVLRTLP